MREEPIAHLEGTNGQLERIVFDNGDVLPRRAMFFNTGQDQRCDLASKLGCELTERGAVRTGDYEMTNVPGLFVAGDSSRAVQLAIVAAAEGAEAAFAINKALIKENLLWKNSMGFNWGRSLIFVFCTLFFVFLVLGSFICAAQIADLDLNRAESRRPVWIPNLVSPCFFGKEIDPCFAS